MRLIAAFKGTYPFKPIVKLVQYIAAALTATAVGLRCYYIGEVDGAVGFQYCTDKEGAKTDVAGSKTQDKHEFTATLTGLHSATKYYVRGFITVDSVKIYGATWYEITTEENNIVIVNSAASEIAQTTATIGAEFTSNAANISAAKMQYCTDVEGTITDVDITPIASPISTPLTELAAGTKYYYRLKLTCEEEDVVSEWAEFTTLTAE